MPLKLTLTQKVRILEESKNVDFYAVSRKNMCHEYGIRDPTISLIVKNEKKILAAYDLELSTKPKTIIKAAAPEIENTLYEWFKNECNENVLVDGSLLMTKAKDLHSKSKDKNVKFSFGGGWFEDFKERYEIQFLQVGDSKLKSYKPNPNFKTEVETEVLTAPTTSPIFVHKLKKASNQAYNDDSK